MAPDHHLGYRCGPFPHLPSDPLNDRIFDASIFHVVKNGSGVLFSDQRMLELWNNWYETLASMEALATVIVIVAGTAGVITLAESRRR